MTQTDIDTSVIESLDFELNCTLTQCQSGHPKATHFYALNIPCHPYSHVVCTPCAEYIKKLKEYALDGFIGLRCPHCYERTEPEAIEIKPLP